MFSVLHRTARFEFPPGTLNTMSSQALRAIEEAHKSACEAGISHYKDPETGYKVFTSASHEKRGFCCGNACRHCPYGHLEVKAEWRPADSFPKVDGHVYSSNRLLLTSDHGDKPTSLLHIQFAVNMPRRRIYVALENDQARRYREGRKAKLTVGKAWNKFTDEDAERIVLFWSGGKDSFLTLRALQKRGGKERITLLTTFDGKTGKIPFHNTKITDVLAQARHERLDALVVPLGGGTGPYPDAYAVTLKAALKPLKIKALAFGDLHLQDLRSWREDIFSGVYPCEFPLFHVPYEELLSRLWAERGVTLRVCAVSPDHKGLEGLSEGGVYSKAFLEGLPPGVDIMGENGEFHTHVFHNVGEDDDSSSDSDSTAFAGGKHCEGEVSPS